MLNSSLGFFFKGSVRGTVKFILMIVLAVFLALGSLFTFSYVSLWISGYKDYIFYLIPHSSMLVAMGIIYFWFFILFYRVSYKIYMKKFQVEETENLESKFDKNINRKNDDLVSQLLTFYDKFNNKRLVKIIAIIISILGFFYSFTTYNVIKEDKIIVHNPLYLKGKTYTYNDIAQINTGISNDKDSNLYYKLKLKDGKQINITAVSMDTKDDAYEVSIYNIDQKLVKNGVKKKIDTKNINKFYNKGYDERYVKNVEKILK